MIPRAVVAGLSEKGDAMRGYAIETMVVVVAVLAAAATVSCSKGGDDGTADGGGEEARTEEAVGDGPAGRLDGGKVCIPGSVRCTPANDAVEACAADGMTFEPDHPCLDGNPCTDDGCAEGTCLFTPAAACDDQDPCSTDICLPYSGECLHEPAHDQGGCCTADADCDDGRPFTEDLCDLAFGTCLNQAQGVNVQFLHKFGSKGKGPGQMTTPKGIAVLADGRILVADAGNNRVLAFTPAGEQAAELGEAVGQTLKSPGCVYEAPDLRIFVCDTGNDRMVLLDQTLTPQKQWPPADAGVTMFYSPTDVVVDSEGSAFVTDGPGEEFDTGNRIVKLNSKGQVTDQQGKGGEADGNFDKPSGIALASNGNFFVSDQTNDRIQILNPSLDFVSKFGGKIPPAEEGGEETPALLKSPSDVVILPDDSILVADNGNQMVRVFTGCTPDCTKRVCGDDGCGKACGECPSFGSCNPQNQCDGWVGEAGDGCLNKKGTGEMKCGGCPCETCVCTGEGALDPSLFFQGAPSDPYCCETEWDDVCAFECQAVCGFSCPIPDDYAWPVHDPTFSPAGEWKDAPGQPFVSPLKLALGKFGMVYVLDTVKAEVLVFRLFE
jgi:hypothetical protein